MCLYCDPLCVKLLPLEEDLLQCHRSQQEAQLHSQQLEQKVRELEEKNVATVDERERQVKLMEVTCLSNPQRKPHSVVAWSTLPETVFVNVGVHQPLPREKDNNTKVTVPYCSAVINTCSQLSVWKCSTDTIYIPLGLQVCVISRGSIMSLFSTVCFSDDKTLHGDTHCWHCISARKSSCLLWEVIRPVWVFLLHTVLLVLVVCTWLKYVCFNYMSFLCMYFICFDISIFIYIVIVLWLKPVV